MKEQVIQFARIQYQHVLSDTTLMPEQRLYQLSMPLLALATLKDEDGYGHVLAEMEFILNDDQQKSHIQKPWQLWMSGRMALASKLAGNVPKLNAIKENLSQQLFQYKDKDIITGWAFAYLAAIDKHAYKQCREKLFAYTEVARHRYKENSVTDSASEASNFIWTLVMNLYAAAGAENAADYLYFQQQLKSLTEGNSLKAAARLVPDEDYRQWLVSMARYSFQIMNDEVSLKELGNIPQSEIKNLDSMLAWANEILLDSLADLTHQKPLKISTVLD